MFVRKRGNSRQDVRGIFAACRASSVRPVVEPIQFDGCTILGDWRVSFGNGENAIARISEEYATFLTNTGDYRFMPRIVGLETDWRTYVPKQNHIAYSVFDGAHAFRFDARVEEIAGECKMTGTFFYAPDTVVDFTAVRDDDAKLPDGFSLTTATRDNLAGLAFPDLAGNSQKITELLAGNPGIIEIFGSWCPNCHDAAELLAELDKKHRDQGLRIIGLAFEYADEFEKQAARVKTYLARHKINFPILIAGEADKEKATQSLAVLDRIRAFPTFLFIDRSGKIRAIYSGF
ncbi:MAG: TlpA disulfide reductase family protein, partial [Phycisphaerae bacterium]